MKTKAKFLVEIEFDTDKKLSKKDIKRITQNIFDGLESQTNSEKGLAPDGTIDEKENSGHTTRIKVVDKKHNFEVDLKVI